MRRNSHLGSGSTQPSSSHKRRSSDRPRLAGPVKPPKSVEVESSIVGLPGLKRVDMVAADEKPKPEVTEEPEAIVTVPSGLVPVPRDKPTEPAFGNRLGRSK